MFYSVYFQRGPSSLKANSYRLDERISIQCRVNISDSIYRPVGNSSPDGTVQGAVLKRWQLCFFEWEF